MYPPMSNEREAALTALLAQIHYSDRDLLAEKNRKYNESWKRRGGRGAYFTVIRPIDRFIAILEDGKHDMFEILQQEKDDGRYGHDGTLSAAIKDARCYLALIDAEMVERFQTSTTTR